MKDGKRSREAAEVMRITAEDLKRLSVIETIIPEYGSADASTVKDIVGFMKERMVLFLKKFDNMDGDTIAWDRYRRFRKY